MNGDEAEAALSLLDRLQRAFEMLTAVSRHRHPPDLPNLMSDVEAPDEALKSAKARQVE